ncbi:ABC transporter ATP-binding protein [Xylanimonas protaetiae]|uniref:ABC transporter ATP-binding protein n=1 Tax=Xylanimonas protaetiae TaxID=2509457 RepID=A0A4P6F5A2_9MICO|nr:ABC transporter ATP-binding protein [Xylanimonas protaetiae]QAY70525.1 ABC transporter ATP-binding protein [Xylanimonas protaetiae]
MSAPLISVRDLHKTYGSGANAFHALRGIDLDIHAGESLAIVGKSGSGKSTLMHLLALLDRPTSGSITLHGTETSGLGERELNRTRNAEFGFVFQQFFLNAQNSVMDNVTMPLTIAGVPARERKARGLAALAQLGIEDKAGNKANDLSGGQKQRVVISRALINRPSVIFADEPTGNLDSNTGATVESILFDLNRTQGITLVVVTHDEELAARCDRAVTIADGLIVPAGDKPTTGQPSTE